MIGRALESGVKDTGRKCSAITPNGVAQLEKEFLPFGKPFDYLRVPSGVEELRAVSKAEPPRTYTDLHRQKNLLRVPS